MRSKLMTIFGVVMAIGFLASPTWAKKLIVLSDKTHQGEVTNEQCLSAGDKLAVVDSGGTPRVLTPLELEVIKRENPKILQMPAYSMPHMQQAPELPTTGK